MPRVLKPAVKGPPGSRVILYPYRLYGLEVALRRLVGGPMLARLSVLVDMIRARGFIAAGPVELDEVEGGEAMPARLSPAQADRLARRAALYYILRRHRPVIPPRIRVVESSDVYKIFWLARVGGRSLLVDSLTGAHEELSST